jgi:hypothetical protein
VRFISHLYPSDQICRFAYSDYALAHSLRARNTRGIPLALAYDSACSYSVNIVNRFSTHIPEYQDTVAQIKFLIDSLHVHNHVDKCMYCFSSSYQDNMGHFHGTAVEQYWSEHNGMGPQTCQMNPGHRHEVITAHHSYWNWKKLTRIGKCGEFISLLPLTMNYYKYCSWLML